MLKIKFNGKTEEIASGTTIRIFLESRNIKKPNLILELNDEVLPSLSESGETVLKNGDCLNVFSLVGGG